MKAIGFSQLGHPDVLELISLPDPVPGSDEVVIETRFIGVNFADIYRRRGEYPSEGPSPYVLGHEGAGVIHAVGENVKDFSVGDRVGFAHVPRSNAGYVKAPAWKVIPLPEAISFEAAASVLLQGLTAHYLVNDSYKVKPSDTVLIHSASGGVGLLLTQLCKLVGAEVIGTVSTSDKIDVAKEAGADHVVIRSNKDWKSAVLKLTEGRGVDVAYDAIGSTLEETLASVRPKGTAVYFGWSGGAPPKIDPSLLMNDSKTLTGGELWSHISTREELLRRANYLFSLIQEKRLFPRIYREFPLSEAAAAHRVLESGVSQGKILLKNDLQAFL
jgi:NADPH2:quinone reductase